MGEVIVRILWNNQVIRMDNLGVISYEFMRERSDPDLTYEVKPNLNYESSEYHIITNRDGFRDRDYPLKKGSDVYRILVLGDSITFGYGIKENSDIFYNVLEEKLNYESGEILPAKRFEVIGIAAPGYNTFTELSILKKKGLKYDPDLVIFAYCLNDSRDACYSFEYAKGAKVGRSDTSILKLPSWMRRALRKSVLYSYLANKANRIRSYLGAGKVLKRDDVEKKDNISAKDAAKPVKNEPDSPKSVKNVSENLYCPEGSQWCSIYKSSHSGRCLGIMDDYILNELGGVARKDDFDVLFLIFPNFEKVETYYPQGQKYLFDDVHTSLEGLFRKHGFMVLDMKDCFNGRSFTDVAIDDCHPSVEGHSIAAHAIYDYLDVYLRQAN